MLRRTVAGVGVLVVLILLILGVRGCLNARQEQAIEDYSNDSVEILRASKLEGDSLFELLQSEGGTDRAVDIQTTLNGYQVESNQLIDQANDLDVPGDVSDAQDYLLDILELRRDGLRTVSRAMQVALGDQERREGTQAVTGAMQIFLASDTLQQLRFEPELNEVLEDEGLPIPRYPSEFVPDVEWLDGAFVADQVNALRTGQGGGDEAAAPGLHGNGIAGVSLGGTALTPGGSATVQLSEDLAFEIQVQNQGENTETDVNVRVTVGEGNDAIELEEPIDTIAAGEIQTVTIPLADQPPTGQNVPITVEVEPVPGEEVTDNNTQEFSVIFTR
jgi:hypothetical protein